MRVSAPLLAAAGAAIAIVAGVAIVFTVTRNDASVPPESSVARPGGGATDRGEPAPPGGGAGEAPAPAGSTESRAAAEAPPARSVAEIVEELRQVARTRRGSPERLLRELIAKGGDEAILAVAALIADPAFDMPNRAAVFAEVLRGLDDPRIADAARDVLQRQVDAGETDPNRLAGYLDLVARQGGRAGAETLLALLEKTKGPLATAAAATVAAAADRSTGSAFLDLVRSGKCADARTLFESLASWNDPAVLDEMSRLAWNASLPADVRGDAAELASRALPPEALPTLASRYAAAERPEEKQIVFRALSGFAANENATPEALRAAALPLVEKALADPDRLVWRDAAALLREERTYRTPETIAALESLAAKLPPNGADARYVRQILAKAKKPAKEE